MGHDIYGLRPIEKQEIAYLRRGAFNPLKNVIYEALGAHDCNGGVSGCGERIFKKHELEEALKYLGKDDEDLNPEREFLANCIKNVENGEILIDFS